MLARITSGVSRPRVTVAGCRPRRPAAQTSPARPSPARPGPASSTAAQMLTTRETSGRPSRHVTPQSQRVTPVTLRRTGRHGAAE